VIIGSNTKGLQVWNRESCAHITTLDESRVYCSVLQEKVLFSAMLDRTVKKWEVSTGECSQVYVGATNAIRCLDAHETILAGGSEESVCIWNIQTADCMRVILYDASVSTLLLQGSLLFVGSKDGCIKSWDIRRGELLEEFQEKSVVQFQLQGTTLVSGSQYNSITLRQFILRRDETLEPEKKRARIDQALPR